MKYSIALSALASVAAVCAESVYFVAVSEDKSLNFPIFAAHETAGSNYFLDASVPEPNSGRVVTPTVFELKDGVATADYGTNVAHVGVANKYFASGPGIPPQTFTFNGDVIDNYNFYACKNTNDPYKYSKQRYIIAVSDKSNNSAPFEECTPVNILKHAADASSSTSKMPLPSETAVTTSASSSSMNAPSEVFTTTGSTNTTLTTSTTDPSIPTGTTVTDYTTFCPESTTVTVTMCSEHKCTPHEFTVTTATTLTVPGECIIVPTEAPSVPSVPTANAGAAMAASGVLGLAGIAAIFL